MGGDKFSLVPQNEDTFSWTQVEDESDLVMPATLKQSLSKSSPKGTPTGVVAVNSLFLQRSLMSYCKVLIIVICGALCPRAKT
jgi:hypothetical protein